MNGVIFVYINYYSPPPSMVFLKGFLIFFMNECFTRFDSLNNKLTSFDLSRGKTIQGVGVLILIFINITTPGVRYRGTERS
jgi:hypothetical protein